MATRRTSSTNQEKTPLIPLRQRQQKQHHDPYSPITHDLDKEDRRSIFGRATATSLALLSFVQNNANSIVRSGTPTGGFATLDKMSSHDMVNGEEYYEDTYNDLPWRCSFGTREDDGIWMNRNDQAGFIMSFIVWILIIYSGITVTLLAHHNHVHRFLAMAYCTICALALASHAKTTFTDPGAIPQTAVPLLRTDVHPANRTMHAMCSHCQTYKPPLTHHCRICDRCISRMDHHCPWMNNCIGIGNIKHFILFLFYTFMASVLAMIIFTRNYYLCVTSTGMESCVFSILLIQLVRAMTCIALVSLLFTASMLNNVLFGVMTGVGTIDRLKRKATNNKAKNYSHENNQGTEDNEQPIPWRDIFGIQGYWTWWLPMDPLFDDYDRTFGYTTPQRLLREQGQKRRNQSDTSSEGRDDVPAKTNSWGYSQV